MSSNSIYTTVKSLVEFYSTRPQPWLEFSPIISEYQISIDPIDDDDDESITAWGFGLKELNPNFGGQLTKQAWEDGAYKDRDQSTASKKGWETRDRSVAALKMRTGFSKWKNDNCEYWLSEQRRKLDLAYEARKNNLQKLEYCGIIYRGWSELERATGKSKFLLKKNNKVTIL